MGPPVKRAFVCLTQSDCLVGEGLEVVLPALRALKGASSEGCGSGLVLKGVCPALERPYLGQLVRVQGQEEPHASSIWTAHNWGRSENNASK